TRWYRDWSSDVCSSDLVLAEPADVAAERGGNEIRTDRDEGEARGTPARGGVLPQRGGDDRAEAEVPRQRPRFVRLLAGRREEHQIGRPSCRESEAACVA